jgi:hypothetical protein
MDPSNFIPTPSNTPLARGTRAFDQLVSNQWTDFEKKLYGENERKSKGVYKYPLELLTDPSHQSVMKISIFDNDPQYLSTKREVISTIVGSLAQSVTNAVTAGRNAENAKPVDERQDASGIVGGVVAAGSAVARGVGVIADTLIQAISSGNLQGRGEGRDSYTEEQTGLQGGTKEVAETIYLYMPTGIEVGYGMVYEDASMAGLDAIKLVKGIAQGDAAAAADIGKKIGMANLKVLDSVGELVGAEAGTFAKFLSASQRQVVNPMSLHLFKEVNRRSFTFAYTFLPRSREEMETCHEIVGLLKFFAHPKRSEGSGRFLDYPAEFGISFLTGDGKENAYMPKILKCSLESVKVKYGEETSFSTFRTDQYGAAPTKMTMELSFSELEILTRDRLSWKLSGTPSP